jgi:DNA invertase Pin-like site-specific DNA recombinase
MNCEEKKTVAAYIRVSTEDQLEFSPDSQLKKIQEYVKGRGLVLPESYVFMDEGISGREARNRPAFMRMIRMAKETPRPYDQILVWKFSRFARNRQDSIFYKSMLRRECGIQVISITEQLSEDPTSILIEALLEAMDEYYSVNLAQEVIRGMNEKFSRGGVVNPPPFGYRMGDGIYEPDEECAPYVSGIFRLFLSGLSCKEIAAELNARGIRTSRGNLFQARSIRYILQNPVYTGSLRRHIDGKNQESFQLVRSDHMPLVSKEMFELTQKEIGKIKENHGSHIATQA